MKNLLTNEALVVCYQDGIKGTTTIARNLDYASYNG